MAFNATATMRRVKGLEKLNRQLTAIPKAVKEDVAHEMEIRSARLAAAIKRAATAVDLQLAGTVDYTQGAPAGSNKLSTTAIKGADGLAWHVHEGSADVFWAQWTEHGTAPHSLAKGADLSRGKRQTQGIMHPGARAQPHFWPTVRLHLKPIKSGVAGAGRKAVKRVVGGSSPTARSGQFDTRASKG